MSLGEDLAVSASLDRGLEPPFLGVEAELGQAGRFKPAGLPLFELGIRASAPQGERLAQGVRSTVSLTELEELVATGDERIEPARVDSIDQECEPVAVTSGFMASGPRTLRSRTTQVCRFLCQDAGGVSPQTTWESWSALSDSSPATARAARTSVSRGPRRAVEPSSLRGPRTEIPTHRMCRAF